MTLANAALDAYRLVSGWAVAFAVTCVALLVLLVMADVARERRRPSPLTAGDARQVPTEPSPVMPGPREQCPWCDTRACLDPGQCNCKTRCGSWLCKRPEITDAEISRHVTEWQRQKGDGRDR